MAQTRLEAAGSPTGWKRKLYRAPIPLHRAGLGFLFGKRLLILEHQGRTTGETRRTALETVANHPDAVYVAAAWGSKAHWLQNIKARPRVTVYLGSMKYEADAKVIDRETARKILGEYAAKHPRTFSGLVRFMLDNSGATTEERVARLSMVIPLVRLPKP